MSNRLTFVVAALAFFSLSETVAADPKPNPVKKPQPLPVAPLPRIVPPRNETEEQKQQRACHECKRLEEAINSYVTHPKNPGKTYGDKLPTSPNDLINPPFGAASLLPRGKEELIDPWGQPYEYRLNSDRDGNTFVLIYTRSDKDATPISQYGIGDPAYPRDK